MANFKLPPIINEKYEELYNLCQNCHDDGLLKPEQVARFYGRTPDWFRRVIFNHDCPFAFGSDKDVKRGTTCVHVLPFYFYNVPGAINFFTDDIKGMITF